MRVDLADYIRPRKSILFGILMLLLNISASAQIRNVLINDTRKVDLAEVFRNTFASDEVKKKEKTDKIYKVKQKNKKVYISFIPVSSKRRGNKNRKSNL